MTENFLTKKQLEKLIRDEDPSVKFLQKKTTSRSSEWWVHFHQILVNNKQQQFVSCNSCKKLLAFMSSNGTNNLRSHFASCSKRSDVQSPIHQQTINEFYGPGKQLKIPKRIKLSITQTCSEFCALDGRAFDLIQGDGFRNLAKVLFEAGGLMQKSSTRMEDLLPHPTTISRNITRIYEESKKKLVNICGKLQRYCLVIDQWTEGYTGISYCGIALRFVDENFQLFTYILGCYPYDAPSHSAQHLREFVNKKLEEYGLKLDATKYVVSDNEPKMIAAFREQCLRVGCSDHYLNKQLQHAFESEQIHLNKNTIEKVDCDMIQSLFSGVKRIVCSVRRSHRQQQLSRKLQSYSETRFNGALIMLDVFRQVFFELPVVLINSKSMDDYYLIQKQVLDDICSFLEPFEEVIATLSQDQQPVLHLVIPLRQCLINQCNIEEEDSTAIIQVKTFLGMEKLGLASIKFVHREGKMPLDLLSIVERRIKNAWPISDQHRIATILHPKLKNFENCPDEKNQSIAALKVELEKYLPTDLSSNSNSSISVNTNSESSSTMANTTAKRKNLLSQCFDSIIEKTSKPSNPHIEMDEYLTCNIFHHNHDRGDDADDMDVLLFWKEKQHSYPILSLIARDIFSIPASNTIIERLFSSSKNIVSEKRTSLGSEKINQLLFLQKNLENLKKIKDIDSRKRTISMSSTTTVSSEEFGCSIPKQQRFDLENNSSDSDEIEFLS